MLANEAPSVSTGIRIREIPERAVGGPSFAGGDGMVFENPSEEREDATLRLAVGGDHSTYVQDMARRLREFFSEVCCQLVMSPFKPSWCLFLHC